jgi:hypothetical protein
MKKNDIVSVVAQSGEYVGKYNGEKDGVLLINDPRMLVATAENEIGFARGVCMTGRENPTSAQFKNYVYVVATSDDFASSYRQAVSGLII